MSLVRIPSTLFTARELFIIQLFFLFFLFLFLFVRLFPSCTIYLLIIINNEPRERLFSNYLILKSKPCFYLYYIGSILNHMLTLWGLKSMQCNVQCVCVCPGEKEDRNICGGIINCK